MSGGASGAPDALWEDEGHRKNIKDYLDTGEIDVFTDLLVSSLWNLISNRMLQSGISPVCS